MPWYRRLSNLFRANRLSREFDREAEFHMAERVDDLVSNGMPLEDARRQARRQFGNPGVHKDATRDVDITPWIESLTTDLRFALRNIRSRPLLSATVVVTLAVSLGISTGIFAVVDVTALRARVDGDRRTFVQVMSTYATDTTPATWPGGTAWADYLAYRDGARSLRLLAGWAPTAASLDSDPARVNAMLVTCDFFEVYALARPLIGRVLRRDDCSERTPVAVIGEDLWRRRLGARTDIVGRAIRYNGQPVTIVGVAPLGFGGQLNDAKLWLPYSLRQYLGVGPVESDASNPLVVNLDGRLAPGFSRADLRAELKTLASNLDRGESGRRRNTLVTDGSLVENPGNTTVVAALVTLILAALTCLTLVACANVVALLLARAAARQQEMAVRIALGSGTRRLVRMLLTETGLLALGGGCLGALIAMRLPSLLFAWLVNRPVLFPIRPDWTVFAFLAALTLIVGFAAGLLPARASLASDVVSTLKGSRSPAAQNTRLGRVLISAQVAAAMMLLVGAAVLYRVPARVAVTPRLFETVHVIVPNLLAAEPQGGSNSWESFHADVARVLREVPGVEQVAFGSAAPDRDERIGVVNVSPDRGSARALSAIAVSPEYFNTFGIPILSGRSIAAEDASCAELCSAVISEEAARELWPDGHPLGRRLSVDRSTAFVVVGVARNVVAGAAQRGDAMGLYRPWSPALQPYHAYVRFRGESESVSRAIVTALRSRFPDATVGPETIQAAMDWETASYRRLGMMVGVVALIAGGLALLGVYGVVALGVRRRRKEIGIRLALGARKGDVHGAIFAIGARPVGIGLGIGLIATGVVAVGIDRIASRSLPAAFFDPFALAGSALALAAVAFVAMFIPSLRATRIDPLETIREEG